MTPYCSSIRPTSSYSSGSDPVQAPDQGLNNQGANQIMDSAESYGFVGAGLNVSSGDCQGQAYSPAGHSGKAALDKCNSPNKTSILEDSANMLIRFNTTMIVPTIFPQSSYGMVNICLSPDNLI